LNAMSGNIVTSQRDILGLPVYDLGWAEAFAFAEEVATMPFGQSVIAFLNASNASLMMQDPDYRAVLKRQVVLPEGQGLDLASIALHGRRFPTHMTGTDFVPALLTYICRPMRVALIGGQSAALMRVAEGLRRHTPWHEFVPIADGTFDRSDSDAVMERVREANVDILLVSMGSPAQEKWIDRHVGPGHARLVLSVGGLFDAVAEAQQRSLASHGKPRRLGVHRLARGLANPLFLFHVLRYRLSGMKVEQRGSTRMAKAGSL
jgi:exopolysaccharide biosynthesis WecB/TagA/CpsF family protein